MDKTLLALQGAAKAAPAPVRDAGFAPRRECFDWTGSLPRHWCGGDVFRTHYLNALSLLFPDGEAFFIDAVRAVRQSSPSGSDEAVVRAFIGQEGWHRQAHAGMNRYLQDLGMPVEALEAPVRRRIALAKERLPPIAWLAATVCLEHFTAIMAHDLLAHPDELARMHPHFRRLWTWHALEELEHKTVAFDLYRRAGGDARRLRRAMLVVTFTFVHDVLRNLHGLLRADRQLRSWRVYASGISFLLGRRGLIWRLLPNYLRFFRRDFHPRDIDDTGLIQNTARHFGTAVPAA